MERFGMRYPTNTIRFDAKPAADVLALLKGYGFRWNRGAGCWSAAQSIASAAVCDCIRSGEVDPGRVADRVGMAEMQADCGII